MRYFFNKAGSLEDPDNEGLELATISEARITAVKFAGEALREQPDVVWKGDEFRVEVTDHRGLMLFTVVVIGIDSPSLRPSR